MPALNALWHVRGTIPIPQEAADSGLMSRVADIFEQSGATIHEESEARVVFSGLFDWLHKGVFTSMGTFDRGEIKREGSSLRYELRTLHLLIQSMGTSILVGTFLWIFVYPPAALPVALLAFLYGYLIPYAVDRMQVPDFLRRALTN